MELDWSQEAAGPVTLVHARLQNERATDRRVSLRNCLDGPVLPPRRHGVPEAGWDREGPTTVVPAGERVAIGYACPAPPADPPVVVDEVTAAEAPTSDDTAATAIRELGDHRPPRAVLGGGSAESAIDTASAEPVNERPDRESQDSEPSADEPSTPQPIDEPPASGSRYDGLVDRLDRSRTRIRTAEALAAAGVVDATALLETNGGLQSVESLGATLDADARELRALARTASTLADRAAAAAPPIEALRRLS